MNIQEYIESGILEAYVLDALSPTERKEVEAVVSAYPELQEELQAISSAMVSLAETGAMELPKDLKERIWDEISGVMDAPSEKPKPAPAVAARPAVPLPASRPNWQRAAVWAAVAVSVLTNFLLLSQKNKLVTRQVALQHKVDSLQEQQQYLASVVADYDKEREMLADTSMEAVLMKTMQPGHPMAATVYWSRKKGDTYLSIQKLPPPPQGKQYQMWVIQNGKPVSMGVIPDGLVTRGGMARLDMEVTNGQAFAISLEKEGGSPTPTMDQIQVMGKPS